MPGSSSTPVRRKKSEINYLGNIGEVGRRTGLTLAQGPRDEYGMEDADHLFTSPAKSMKSTKSVRSQRKSNLTSASSESMDIEDEDDAPDLRSHLNARSRNTGQRKSIPRSPFHRTNIGSSPRRHPSLDPRSEQRRDSSVASQGSVTSLLSVGDAAPLKSVERRTPTQRPATTIPFEEDNVSDSNSNGNIYSLSNSPLAPRNARMRPPQTPRFIEDDREPAYEDFDDQPPALEDDQDVQMEAGDSQDEGSVVVKAAQEVKKGRGRPRKSGTSESSQVNGTNRNSLNRGRVSGGARLSDQSLNNNNSRRSLVEEEHVELPDDYMEIEPEPGYDTPQDDVAEAQAQAQASSQKPEPKPRGRPKKGQKAALTEKDGNARKNTKKVPKARVERGASAPRDIRGTSVPLQRAKELDPDGDDGAAHTRSGRLTYKPIQFWKNERLEYDNDGRHGMQTIKSIVRMEDRTPVKRAASSQPGRRKKRRARSAMYEEEEDEVEEEEWEVQDGIMSGVVKVWDSLAGQADEETEEKELAFAGNRIETREVERAMFRYAKTLTMPFFGSGMVELPPHGFKRTKNSRKMQMVFFVHYGKVRVEVGETSFAISKGGVWQVPRGNFYSITNETDKEAKIFFAQGCEVSPELVGNSQNGPDVGE